MKRSTTLAPRTRSAQRTKAPSVRYADPVLRSVLEAASGVAVTLTARHNVWCTGSGFSRAYVSDWRRDGGPFGVAARALYAVARSLKADAQAILALFQTVVMHADSHLTNQQLVDSYLELVDREHDAEAAENRATAKAAGSFDPEELITAHLRKASIHQTIAARLIDLQARGINPYTWGRA